ncbi:MAG: class I SAM-dependent methyltransferase [Phycisphaerales bacterium]|jgi:ubiquinone/menaquinone biosynthesis C-methylase UbiE|nr:class I SAM-dependent methyltransferase [Phycisphaerales bacterium]
MNPNKALWEKGDFTRIAAFMRDAGSAFAGSLGVAPGMRVLDVGCGDGTTALPMAELGADVTGVDIASNLVAAGNRRAAEAGLKNLRFHEGDACDLAGIEDDSFDLSVSVFGAMFAPRPEDVARHLVRVTKPGGRVIMGNWIPNDPTSFISKLLNISVSYTPPPPEGFVSPMLWGVEDHIVARFERAGVPREKISMERDTFAFVSDRTSPEGMIEVFRDWYGPTMNAYAAAAAKGLTGELHAKLVDLANGENTAGSGGTSITATFMRVSVGV